MWCTTANGRIVAAVRLDDEPDGGEGPRPLPGDGHRAVEIEVPAEYRDLGLAEICSGLRVDHERVIARQQPDRRS